MEIYLSMSLADKAATAGRLETINGFRFRPAFQVSEEPGPALDGFSAPSPKP